MQKTGERLASRRLAAPDVENDPACLALGAVGGLHGLRWGVEG